MGALGPNARSTFDTRPKTRDNLTAMPSSLRHFPLTTLPSPELVASYLGADYVTDGITLRLDMPVPDLPAWRRSHNCKRAVLITGWNPFSQELESDENQARNEVLRLELEERRLTALAAVGRSRDDTSWEEPGFCVLDCDDTATDNLMVRFCQYAVVIAEQDGCKLVWHPAIREAGLGLP